MEKHAALRSRRRRKKRARRLALLIVCTVAVLAVLVTVAISLWMPKYHYNPIEVSKPEELGFENVFSEKVVNIALFGLDAREPDTFTGLSDSIMILSLNSETKKIKLFSVMRDSLVAIEKNGKTSYTKINSAYLQGGPQLAIKTLNQNFGLDISEYATVNFYGLTKIIDAVGTIDITLTDAEVTAHGTTHQSGINDYIREICLHMGLDYEQYKVTTPGLIHANGVQAVAYSRIRYVKNIWGGSDDFGRTDRQQYVMEQLFQKALTMDKANYVSLAKAAAPYMETSLSYNEIMGLAFDILLKSPSFEQNRIPRYEFVMESPAAHSNCVYYDLNYAAAVIKAVIYDDVTIDEYEDLHPVEKKDWFRTIA